MQIFFGEYNKCKHICLFAYEWVYAQSVARDKAKAVRSLSDGTKSDEWKKTCAAKWKRDVVGVAKGLMEIDFSATKNALASMCVYYTYMCVCYKRRL